MACEEVFANRTFDKGLMSGSSKDLCKFREKSKPAGETTEEGCVSIYRRTIDIGELFISEGSRGRQILATITTH